MSHTCKHDAETLKQLQALRKRNADLTNRWNKMRKHTFKKTLLEIEYYSNQNEMRQLEGKA